MQPVISNITDGILLQEFIDIDSTTSTAAAITDDVDDIINSVIDENNIMELNSNSDSDDNRTSADCIPN